MNVENATQIRLDHNTGPGEIRAAAVSALGAEQVDQFINLMKQENWPALYSGLLDTRPNLASVISTIDLLLPHDNKEINDLLGLRIRVGDQLRGYRKPSYTVTPCSKVHNHPIETRPQVASGTAGTSFTQSLYSLFSRTNQTTKATASTPGRHDENLEEFAEDHTQRRSTSHSPLMQELLSKALTDLPDLSVEVIGSNSEAIDITDDSAALILKYLAGQNIQTSTLDPEVIHKTLLASEPLSTGQTTLPYSVRQKALVSCVPLAEFYSAVGAALTIQDKDPNAVERFNVASENYLSEKSADQSNWDKDGRIFFETFCPLVSRQVMEEFDGTPPFQICMDGHQVPLNDVSEVFDYVFEQARQHLLARGVGERPPVELRYPVMVYKTLSKVLNIEMPVYLTEHETQLEQQVTRNQAVLAQKTAENRQRIALAQAETARRKEEAARQKAEFCVQHHLSHPSYISLWAGSAPANSATSTVEYSHRLQCAGQGPELFYGIQDMLGASRDHQQIASVDRTLEAIQTRQRFRRDNRCWLRATWISVFDQIEHPDEITTMFAKLDRHETSAFDYQLLLLKAVWHDYKTNRDELLHRGEPGGLNRDAHFMAGRKVGEYLESRGIPTQQYIPDLMERKVESDLSNLSSNFAMGMRGEEKPRFDGNVANLMYIAPLMNSEYVVAVHRVVEKPCFVIERSMNNQVSVLFSGAKDDQELGNISVELEQRIKNAAVQLEDLAPLFEKYKHVPVIMLNAEHYTVYLPKAQQETALPEIRLQGTPSVGEEPESPTSQQGNADNSTTTVFARYQGQVLPIKANHVDFGNTGSALVGQTSASMNEALLNISKLLEESAGGQPAEFFEYISPLARVTPEKSRHPGSIACLKVLMQQSRENNRLLEINGKTIVDLRKIRLDGDPEWVARYVIEYVDQADPQHRMFAGVIQASPEFSDRHLKAGQLIDSLRALRRNDNLTGGKRLLFSAMGVGRSASLAVIDKAMAAIQAGFLNRPEQVDDWLKDAKAAGIRDRGPYFLASQAQMLELRTAVWELLRMRQQGNAHEVA